MRSDGVAPAPSSRWSWLSSQGLGVCCGLATVALLAVGSIVIAATRDGASAGVRLDDLREFFVRPAVAHLWLYLLVPVLGLYALNTLLATWHSVVVKWRMGLRRPQGYAAALVHLGFLVALLAHLVGGFASAEESVLLDSAWSDLPDGRAVRLLGVDVERLVDGTPRTIRAGVELRGRDGAVEARTIGFNEPLSSGFGSTLVLLQRPVAVPSTAVVASAGQHCTLRRGESCLLAGRQARLLELRESAAGVVAHVAVDDRAEWIAQGESRGFDPGVVVAIRAVERGPGALVTWRRAPGNPLALAAALLLLAGLLLMWDHWSPKPGTLHFFSKFF